jgi:APA family basic amino acid/polyamine antiporter
MWGYADVGADIYVGLGLVILAAQGFTPIAFLYAGLVYALVGLCYSELASAYPVAGGGQYFTLRGLGDLAGFIAGAALLLDYTIDISLFSVISVGYFNFFLRFLVDQHWATIHLPWVEFHWFWMAETLVGILLLIWLNIRGIRVSSLFNNVVGVAAIIGQAVIVVTGFVLVWHPDVVAANFQLHAPTTGNFAKGASLAIISFVGLESISQVAQETRRPATVIPRTSIGLILSVLLFALSFSLLAVGMFDNLNDFKGHEGDPVAVVAGKIPVIGIVAAPFTALIGGLIVYISANSGVVSVSRLTYSMSQFQLLPRWFHQVHRKYLTPARTIVVFSGVAIAQTVFAFLTPGPPNENSAVDILGDLYAFGATSGYLLVFLSLIVLRFRDPYTPRPYKMPWNIRLQRPGHAVDFPVLGAVGMLGVGSILLYVMLTHPIGRFAGPGWIVIAIGLYLLYRTARRLPRWGDIPRDWETAQKRVLKDAEEFESLEEYEAALAERDAQRRRPK